jgi:hypothetical protein
LHPEVFCLWHHDAGGGERSSLQTPQTWLTQTVFSTKIAFLFFILQKPFQIFEGKNTTDEIDAR